MGFAVMGIFLIHGMFPDQSILTDAAALIQQYHPEVEKAQWATLTSDIANHPENFSPEMIQQLKAMMDSNDWTHKLALLSYEGTVNPERILPAVLLFSVQKGFRGLLLIALIAACMSTFDSTINFTTGLVVRDVYQKYLRPKASTKELIYTSWAVVLLVVCLSFIFAYSIRSINDIWGWVVMGLGGGLLMPLVLRLYWWRFNGGGFAIGTAMGMLGAFYQRIFYPDLNEISQLIFIGASGMIGSIVGSYLTKPTDRKVLENFYKITRPFGFWGPLKNTVSAQLQESMRCEHRHDLLALPFVMLWHITLFLIPMQFVIGTYKTMAITMVPFAIGLTGMHFLWYRNLPTSEVSKKKTKYM
jgi:hypothetical protein